VFGVIANPAHTNVFSLQMGTVYLLGAQLKALQCQYFLAGECGANKSENDKFITITFTSCWPRKRSAPRITTLYAAMEVAAVVPSRLRHQTN
jgi:hypothetical protein